MDDHQFKEEEMGSVGELSTVCSQIVLKCLFLARIGWPDVLWSVNKLARAITKWTRACDRRLAQLISFIHHTNDYRQYCHMQIRIVSRLWLILQETQEDSKSTIRRNSVYFRKSHVRNRLQFHTVLQKLRYFLSMQVYAWMEYQLLIFGILGYRSFSFFTKPIKENQRSSTRRLVA